MGVNTSKQCKMLTSGWELLNEVGGGGGTNLYVHAGLKRHV